MMIPYSGKATDDLICYTTKCIDSYFPRGVRLNGINDLPECGGVRA
jgi:hypothetical protein